MGQEECKDQPVADAICGAPVDSSAAACPKRRTGAGPRWFLLRAGLVALLFAGAHVCGWRAHTSVLSGTAAAEVMPALCGVLYIALYAAFVIVAPTFAIAALLLKVADAVSVARRRDPSPGP